MSRKNRFALLIEDDEDLSHIFSSALESADYETNIILDGSQALAYLGTQVPDIVILDLILPGTKGIDILKFIKAEKRLMHTQVVVVTGDSLGAEEVRDTADYVMVKPVSFAQLRDLTTRLH